MWHLKTKLGVFWVIPVSEVGSKYYLGLNDEPLGEYNDAEQAAKDVHDQNTGFLAWDVQARIKAPEHINEWAQGEPKEWENK